MERFLSPDSAADETLSVPIPYADLQNPQSLNLYSYVQNNPLRFTDPEGHDYRVCVNNGNGTQNCQTLSDDQYQSLYHQQNGKQGINLPGGPAGGNITCGGTPCGSVSYTENSLYDPLPRIVVGAMGGQAAGLAFKGVGGLIAGLSGRTAGVAMSETAGQAVAKILLTGGGKQAAKEVVEGLAEGAQKASAKRAVAAATKSESISISQSADGALTITRTRPGFDESQTFTKSIDASGNSATVQTAHDAAGNLVHYDPKN